MAKYKLIGESDGNDQIELTSSNAEDAYDEALGILGWILIEEKNYGTF